jgi:hypothetical protein
MKRTDHCTLGGSPAITSEWLQGALAPLVQNLREDSAECGEDFLDDKEWRELLKLDLLALLQTEAENATHERERLEVEMLLRSDQLADDHRVTVADHAKWRDDLAAQQAAQRPADEIDDQLEADPMIERIARRRKNSEAARTLAILDSLKEGATEA